MAAFTQNAEENVSAGKGVLGGYCYRAPIGTALPTSPDWEPTDGWQCMGFITEDGVSFSTDTESNDFNDMNGTLMDSSQSSYGESFSCSFAETKAATFESIYGSDAVTDANGVLTVNHTGAEPEAFSYVFRLVLKNGRKWVRFAEKCKRTEMDDATVASSEVLAWNATFKALYSATTGGYFKDMFESTETASA